MMVISEKSTYKQIQVMCRFFWGGGKGEGKGGGEFQKWGGFHVDDLPKIRTRLQDSSDIAVWRSNVILQ